MEPVALVVQATVGAFGSCGTCGSPLKSGRTFLVRPSFAFSFLWPPSRGFMLGFCRNPGYATSFSAVFSVFHWSFFPFFFSFLPSCLYLFIYFFPNWASCPLVCLAVWPFVHSFFRGNPAKVVYIYTAVSRKVVQKKHESVRDNAERDYGKLSV